MINSKEPSELLPQVQDKLNQLLVLAYDNGIKLIVTSTYRDFGYQDRLYAQGRTQGGKKVTNAKAGESYHNYRMAFDVAPVIDGKIPWEDTKLWQRIGAWGKMCGLEWGGDFKSPDMPHFQDRMGMTINQLKEKYPNGL